MAKLQKWEITTYWRSVIADNVRFEGETFWYRYLPYEWWWGMTVADLREFDQLLEVHVGEEEPLWEQLIPEDVSYPPLLEPPVEEEEEEPTPEPSLITTLEAPSLPWYATWLKPIIDFIALLTESVVNFFSPIFAPLSPIGEFFKDPMSTVIKGTQNILFKGSDESGATANRLLGELQEGTPDWAKDLRDKLNVWQELYLQPYWDILDVSKYIKPDMTGEQSANTLKDIATLLVDNSTFLFELHTLIESGSLGQFEWVSQLDPMVLSKFGFNSLIQAQALLPYQKGLMVKTEQYYNTQYPYQIPQYTDLINQVVKEVISLDTFVEDMLKLGYDSAQSKRIWDAHFYAPALGNLLTSFRRGTIDEARLTELQILVDLDPRFNEIWHDQWYNDPTTRQARYMFEAGAIDRDRLKSIVVRSGLLPDDVEPFTEYLLTFGEREWKRRYILTVARGYREGKIPEEELRKQIFNVYHSEGVANWIVDTENLTAMIEAKPEVEEKVKPLSLGDIKRLVRKGKMSTADYEGRLTTMGYSTEDIPLMLELIIMERKEEEVKYSTEEIVEGLPKPKVLSLGDLKKAYLIDKIDEGELSLRLTDMGYDMLDINLLIEVLDDSKVTDEQVEKAVSLSTTQLLTAYRYGELDEDGLTAKLLSKGMELLDIEVLIATKKKQWGVE